MSRGRAPGPVVLAIIAALQEHGELTRAEIDRELLEQGIVSASAALSRMTRPNSWGPRRIYIVRWTRECSACTRQLRRPVYALGDKPDARPIKKITPAESCRRWKDHERLKVNSVWQWGMGAEARRRERKTLPPTDAPIVKPRRAKEPQP